MAGPVRPGGRQVPQPRPRPTVSRSNWPSAPAAARTSPSWPRNTTTATAPSAKATGIGAKRGEIKPPEAENVLFQLKDGETAVVELEKGFHVVRLVKRDYAGQTPFDEKTQKQIKEKLTNEIGQVEMKRIVNKLKREAMIVYTKGEN